MSDLACALALSLSGCLWISAKQDLERKDLDGDGIPFDLDCDENSADIHPGAPELPCDDLDNDCDEATKDGPVWLANGAEPTGVFGSIQEALDALDGETDVLLCAGTFRESVILSRPDLVFSGVGTDRTLIDGQAQPGLPVIEVTTSNVTIRDLTVQNGMGRARPKGPYDTWSEGTYGGGICAISADGTLSLMGVRATSNKADYGGGIAVGPGMTLIVGEGSQIDDNNAGSGAGVWLESDAEFSDALIESNDAIVDGGGIATTSRVLTLGTSVLRGNTAGQSGGGVSANPQVVELEVRGGFFEGNESQKGGGVYGASLLDHVVFTNNVAATGGGALTLALTAIACRFEGNSADDGGALSVQGIADIKSDDVGNDTVFISNDADYGGAIETNVSLKLSNAELTGNGSTDERNTLGGAAIWVFSGTASLESTTIVDSRCEGCGALGASPGGSLCYNGVTFNGNTTFDAYFSGTPYLFDEEQSGDPKTGSCTDLGCEPEPCPP